MSFRYSVKGSQLPSMSQIPRSRGASPFLADRCSTWAMGGALFVYSAKGSQLPSMSQIHAWASVMLKNVSSGASGPL